MLKYNPEEDTYEKVSQIDTNVLGAWNLRDPNRVDIMSETGYSSYADYNENGNFQILDFSPFDQTYYFQGYNAITSGDGKVIAVHTSTDT